MTSAISSTISDRALPAALSSFVGRDGETSELAELFERARLVTLTGAPGIGKTRLALEVAGRVAECYSDGVWLLDLAPVGDAALLPRALAATLSVKQTPGVPLTDSVLARLAKRRVLLVVDNCEHLIEACAKLVDVLLSGCPKLSILATSREALALDGEQVWRVPQLSMPPAEDPPSPEALIGYEAVRLFVERAGSAQSGFVFDVADAPVVAEIVRRLDGIPLAIELAAGRVDMLTPAEIATRLDDRFGLLRNASRGHEPRHRALAVALDWSHNLLSPPEQALFRRVAVFTGGFCLEECEAVCKVGEGQAFDLLARLVAKSLVVAETTRRPTARYRLLETIRAYAGDRLEESGEVALVRQAHAQAYLDVAERAEPELTGPSQERWLDRLEAAHANLRSALEWSLANDHVDWALRLASALVLFWRVRCYFSEGRELLETALRAGGGEAPGLRATALWGAGFLAFMAGDPEGAEPMLAESLNLFDALGDARGRARALLILGNSTAMRDIPSALNQLEQSATLAREAGDSWCLAHALAVAGYTHSSRGDLPAARPLFDQCLAAARESEDKHARLFGLFGLGDVARIQGDYRGAAAVLDEALTIARELGADYTEATVLKLLGELAVRQGDYVKAQALLEESLARLPEPAPEGTAMSVLLLLADVAHAEGDLCRARLLVEDAAGRIRPGVSPYALLGLGRLTADEGDPVEARRLLEQALDIARCRRDHQLTGMVLHELGLLARAAGEVSRAAALHHEALALQRKFEEAPGVAASLDALGGLTAAAGRCERATRLLGAATALRERNGYARAPRESGRYQDDLRLAQDGLSTDAFQSALIQGAQMPLDEAVTFASRGRKRQERPASGWASLTETERQVAALVAEGMTNPQIAKRMFIALATVKNHLGRIFAKLGVKSRREVEREVERRR